MLESIAVLLDRIARTEQFQKFGVSANEIFGNSIAVIIKGCCTATGLQILEDYCVSADIPTQKK